MPDFFSSALDSVNNVVNQATNLYTNVSNAYDNALDTAKNLGIINNEGEFTLPEYPGMCEIPGSTDINSWFMVHDRTEQTQQGTFNSIGDALNVDTLDNQIQSRQNTKSILSLPYPQNIQVSDNFEWSAEQRSFLANLSFDENVANSAKNTLEAAGYKISTAVAGDSISKEYKLRNKEVVNPHMAALFKGVGLREISFQFELVPKSREDVQAIVTAINTFKVHAHPAAINSNGGSVANKLKFPDEFSIKIQSKNYQLLSMTNCVITSINTNYTPQGIFAAYDDGFPIAVTLDISFMETRARDRSTVDTISFKG